MNMKKLFVSLLVILLSFSLFVSCEVNKTPETPPKQEATVGKTEITESDFAPVVAQNESAIDYVIKTVNNQLVEKNELMNLNATIKNADGSPIILDRNSSNKYDKIYFDVNYNRVNTTDSEGKNHYYFEPSNEAVKIKYFVNGDSNEQILSTDDRLYNDVKSIVNSKITNKDIEGTECEIIDINGIVNTFASNNSNSPVVIDVEIKFYDKVSSSSPSYTFKAHVEFSIKNDVLNVAGYLKGEKDLNFYIELDLSLDFKNFDIKFFDKDPVIDGTASLTLNRLVVNVLSKYHLTASGKVDLTVGESELKSVGIELTLEEIIDEKNIISIDGIAKYIITGDTSGDLENFYNSVVMYKFKLGDEEYTSQAVKDFLRHAGIFR